MWSESVMKDSRRDQDVILHFDGQARITLEVMQNTAIGSDANLSV